MAIRMTSGVDLPALHQWTGEARATQEAAELLVYSRGWLLRADGQPDFVIRPDDEPLATTHEPFTTDEMNAAILLLETAKQNHPTGWRCLEEMGLKPADTYVRYAFMNADVHLQRLAGEDRRVIYSAGWLNGLGVGAGLSAGRR